MINNLIEKYFQDTADLFKFIFWFILAMIVGVLFYNDHIHKIQLRKYGKLTRGIVYGQSLPGTDGCGTSAWYKFTIENKSYKGAGEPGGCSDSKVASFTGDSVTIVYLPDNPAINKRASDVLENYRHVK